MAKYIFVTGGVCSSLGKGIASSAIGNLLKASGFSVFTQKLDPYLNVDPGTMSPFQHGEVFVTDDGAETDLDLGHYERFIDVPLSKLSSFSTGQVYQKVLDKERKGDFLGGTIQIIPHITDEIKNRIKEAARKSKCDIILCEIGGTVGDIEGQPFLEALRQMRNEEGKENVMFIHLTLLPYLKSSNELKTKPTQLSVKTLQGMGIHPDMIMLRADSKIEKKHMLKVSSFCDVPFEAVIPAPTVKSIYEVPLNFHKYNIVQTICRRFNLRYKKPNLNEWEHMIKRIFESKEELHIGLAGKYNDLDDAYISVIEAIKAASYLQKRKARIVWIDAEKIEAGDKNEWKKLHKVDGVVVPGGFGSRGTEGKILVAQYCREEKIPYLGLCLGSQLMAIEFARNVAGIKNATSEEFSPKAKNKVVHFLPGQHEKRAKGGTLRLGSWPCTIKKGTLAYKCYGVTHIDERHRHRYEFNNKFKSELEKKGLIFSGVSPDRELMEIVELKKHPFMIGSQFHPEFKSRPNRPHPLFREFIKAAL
ncbi:CTP synthase [Patescibacteria group bacterium]|nr:CTP synthase [Patescibacteria group bacterium]MBU1016323.1 CTP synthase [Patescibacteria group bacterium]MBU1685026.1 CTP synthase [Patescibacteria group bacterium]MBU1938834.1 CTP synthase [Patescibacteria group bacterium]